MKIEKETKLNEQMKEHWETDVNANKDIDEALLNLDCWIDSNKEDGSIYNAIGWWNMLETFKDCQKSLEKYEKALDEACKLLEHFNSPTFRVNKRSKEEWKERLLKDE